MKSQNNFLICVLCFVIGFFAATVICVVQINRNWHDLSVKAKHAEYYLDSDGERQWRWKQIQP